MMSTPANVPEYEFQGIDFESGVTLFPDALLEDEHVYFHGTSDANRTSILTEGFRIPTCDPPSVSFARSEKTALGYAVSNRSEQSPDGCVFAVRFETLDDNGKKIEPTGFAHVYKSWALPKIVGVCVIPASYRH